MVARVVHHALKSGAVKDLGGHVLARAHHHRQRFERAAHHAAVRPLKLGAQRRQGATGHQRARAAERAAIGYAAGRRQRDQRVKACILVGTKQALERRQLRPRFVAKPDACIWEFWA